MSFSLSQLNVILSAGGQDGGRAPLGANEKIGLTFFFPTKNISDTGDGNLKIKGLLSICGQGYTLTSAGCWILMGF